MKNKAVFIDRDGTINVDVHYLDEPDKFEMYPSVGEGIKKLKENGFKIIVITNQSGIARGYFTEKQLFDIHERMKKEFQKFDLALDGIYYCPHHPDDKCNCRKPNIGLFKKAIKEHNIDVKKSYILGDKILDIGAGKKIGVRTILIPEPHTREEFLSEKNEWEYDPDYIADDFRDAVKRILENLNGGWFNTTLSEMDRIEQLQKKSLVIVVTKIGASDLKELEQYFRDRVNTLAIITIANPYSKDVLSQCRFYEQDKDVREFNMPSIKIPPSLSHFKFFLVPLVFISAIISVISSILWLKRRFDIYIGMGYVHTLDGLILQRMKLVDKVIYHNSDYFPLPTRIGVRRLFTRIFQLIDGLCTNRSDIVWNISPALIEIKKQKKIITTKSPPQIVVPIGIDTKGIYQKPMSQIDTMSIGFIGVIIYSQGLDLLLEALQEIKQEIPDIKLNIIGSGTYETRVRDIVKKKELENNVIFWGSVSDEAKVKEILSNCAIGVAPYVSSIDNYSRYTEPGKVKKYLSYGLPVVVTKVPQMAVEIESHRAGFAIEYNKEELVAAILKLLNDRELLKEYRKNALRLAFEFDWEVILNKAWSESTVVFEE